MITNQHLADWIAINIMGWEKEKKYGTPPYSMWWWVDSSFAYKWIKPAQGWGRWHPTRSISDAFEVVEKMLHLKRQWVFDYKEFRKSVGKGRCRARFRISDLHEPNWAFAEIRPLAICLAAKKAFEEME